MQCFHVTHERIVISKDDQSGFAASLEVMARTWTDALLWTRLCVAAARDHSGDLISRSQSAQPKISHHMREKPGKITPSTSSPGLSRSRRVPPLVSPCWPPTSRDPAACHSDTSSWVGRRFGEISKVNGSRLAATKCWEPRLLSTYR